MPVNERFVPQCTTEILPAFNQVHLNIPTSATNLPSGKRTTCNLIVFGQLAFSILI